MGRLLIANLATSNFRTVQFIGDEGAVAATKIREAEYYRGMCMGHKNETLREDFEREADSLGGIHIPMARILERLSEVTRSWNNYRAATGLPI